MLARGKPVTGRSKGPVAASAAAGQMGGRALEVPMIMRIWRGRVLHYKEQAYLDYLKQTGLTAYRQIPGNRGVFATTHRVRGVTEYVLVTFWDSIEAIRAFAGDDYEKAVYYPEDDAYLLSREPKVEHYEVKFAAPAFE